MVGNSIVKDTSASSSDSRWATVTVDVEITKSAAESDATLAELFAAIPTTANRYTVTLAKDNANLRVHLNGDNKFVANTENDADMKFTLATSDFTHVDAVADNPATTDVDEAYPEHYHLSVVKTVYLTVNGGTAEANSGIKDSDLTDGSVTLGLTGQISGGSIG